MKNFKKTFGSMMPSASLLAAVAAILLPSCNALDKDSVPVPPSQTPVAETVVPVTDITPESVARMLSGLSIGLDQVKEVHSAVTASSANGYDEEYPFSCVFRSPGLGVGDELLQTRSYSLESGSEPLSGLIEASLAGTRSGCDVLSGSGLQIYWPYSEDWDGETMPVITFNPEIADKASSRNLPEDSNIGFLREQLADGSWIVNEVVVDEEYAMEHPVWVVNANEDAGYLTPQMVEALYPEMSAVAATRATGEFRTLVLKEFKAHRNYDSWLAGGSEFFVKCGALDGFKAQTEDEIKLYTPSVTDMMINVKRKQVGKTLRFNSVVVSEWSPQLEECVFLMIEDDGGKKTSWKASGTVKIKSKSYGFEVEIPLNRNDDLVWRGKLSSSYFEKYNGAANRFGDVSVTFAFK